MHAEIGDFIVEILQNAVESGGRHIRLDIFQTPDSFEFQIQDNGKGMSQSIQDRALDPFYSDGFKHPGRRVGLGLPFLKQALEAIGGEFTLESTEGMGTQVRAKFPLNHVDTPPVGSLALTLLTCIAFPGEHELIITRTCSDPAIEYRILRSEILDAAGPLEEPGTLGLIREYVESQEDEHG